MLAGLLMGFGRGPFGRSSFGRSAWARTVLFDSLPAIYRQYDEDNDGVLETFTDAIVPAFENARSKIESWSDLREPLKVRSSSDTAQLVRLGRIKDPDSKIEQRGIDGSINGTRGFQSPTARFRTEDAGKTLSLSGSSLLANNRDFKVASVLSPSTVLCDPPLIPDSGPFKWQLKALPDIPDNEIAIEVRGGDVLDITPGWILFDGQTRFTITHRQQFFPMEGERRLLTEREGPNGQILADGRFQAEVPFTQFDVGKPITLADSAISSNNGKFQIREVDATDSRIVKLWEPYTIPGADANGGITYYLRPGSQTVSVTHLITGPSESLGVTVTGQDITVVLATNSSGLVTSTAAQVVTALAASADANALVSATATGTGLGKAGITDFVTLPGVSLTPDDGLTYWSLLPFPEIWVEGITPPAGIILRENVDLSVSGSTVIAQSGNFSSSHVGDLLVISGSTLGSNGAYPIASVVSQSTCTIATPSPLPAESNLTWSLRTPSSLSSTVDVQVSAPSLLENLASDFALTIDERESETQQRSWIENSVQWMDLKGSAKAYELIGGISGFHTDSTGLFHIRRPALDVIPSAARTIIGETGVGRTGLDGRVYSAGSVYFFTSNSAHFLKTDVGLSLYLRNVSNTANEGFFEITEYVDAATVKIDSMGFIVAPEYGLGGTLSSPTVAWRLCRLYSKISSTQPKFDELNVELMQDIVGADSFRMDMYTWDPAYKNSFTVSITNVTPAIASDSPTYYTLEVTGMIQPSTGNYSTARVIQNPAVWQITDSLGHIFYVESVPIQTASGPPEVYTFQVFSSQLPAAGVAVMSYLADSSSSCDFCRSHTAVVTLSAGVVPHQTISDLNTALDIVNTRLMTEVRPEHVLLVPAYDDGIAAIARSLNPDYTLIEYQSANNVVDSISVDDSVTTIKNDQQLIVAGPDTLNISDSISLLTYKILSTQASDSVSSTDSFSGALTQSIATIAWGANGATGTGSDTVNSTVSLAYPTGITAGQLLVAAFYGTYSDSTTLALTSSGWTASPSNSSSIGGGPDNIYAWVYYKVASGSESGSATFTISGGASNTPSGFISRYTTTGYGGWTLGGSGGRSTINTTSHSFTTPSSLALQTRDIVLVFSGMSVATTNVSGSYSGISASETGCTFSAPTVKYSVVDPAVATKPKEEAMTLHTVTAGTGSSALTYTITTVSSCYIVHNIVRLRGLPGTITF